MARQRKPTTPDSSPEQMIARTQEIDAWLSTSDRFEKNIDRTDRLEWHREERTRRRRERSKLVRDLRKLGIEMQADQDPDEAAPEETV